VSWREVLALALVVAGVACDLIAVLGACVMRSVYDRVHYVGLAGYGTGLIALAVLARESLSLIGDKALLVALVMVFGGPIVVQTTLRSLLMRERGDWQAPLRDAGPAAGADR
jgi:multisubunit Na+/H+ antiporter MnhG subunit